MGEAWANWISAIFTAGAVLAAVVMWHGDRQRARAEREEDRKEHLRRMLAALRVEIEMAIEAIQRRQYASGAVVDGVAAAKARGASIFDRPIVPGSATVTDGTI
jgi:hypothetical protein